MSAALSGGKQKQSAQNSSQMSQDVFGPQAGALGNMYNLANSVFVDGQPYSDQGRAFAFEQSKQIANDAKPAWQQQLAGGAYANLGIGNQLMQSLQQSQNTPSNMQAVNGMIMGGNGNNYADAMKASFIGDANRTADNMMRTLDARATGSGMSGGSRHGLAEAQGFYDVNSNLQHNLAQVGYNTFDKDLERKLSIAQQADQGNLGRQQLLTGLLNNQNQAQAGAVQFGEGMQNLGLGTMAPASAGWGNLQGLSNAIGQPTVLSSGSSQGSSNGSGWNASTSGSIGGKGSSGSK
jgi:hypothetical protein